MLPYTVLGAIEPNLPSHSKAIVNYFETPQNLTLLNLVLCLNSLWTLAPVGEAQKDLQKWLW